MMTKLYLKVTSAKEKLKKQADFVEEYLKNNKQMEL